MANDPLTVASYYVDLFAARTDVHSRWTPDGWRPQRAPLTPEIALAGLTKHGPPISVFTCAPGSVSHVFAVDFDTEHGWNQAVALGRAFADAGAPVILEYSNRGAHLWGVVETQLPARTLRRFIHFGLERAHLPHDDPKIELRPGQDIMDDDKLGFALRAPSMPHPATGKQSPLINPRTLRPMGDRLSTALVEVEFIPSSIVIEGAMQYVPMIDPANIPRDRRPPRAPRPDDDESASDILTMLWGAVNARPGKAIRCPAHDDQHPSLFVFNDDLRAVCYSPTCELHNGGRGRGTWELKHMAPIAASNRPGTTH